jgi:predicted Zn-dependent peptidase
MRRTWITCLFLALTGLPAVARETPPPPGEPRDFELAGSDRIALGNGLEITFIDYGTVPMVTVIAVVGTGNIDDGEKTWIADVTTEMLKEGTTTRSAPELARLAADLGGQLFVGAGAEQTSVGLSVLSEHAAIAAELVADVLRNPAFPESELPRIVADLQRSVSVARTSPDSIAAEALAELVYGNHPFGRLLPAEEQLATYSLEDVRRFYAENFGARRTHVYVAGRYDRLALEASLREAFGDWITGAPPTDDPPRASEAFRVRLIDRPGAPQSSIRIAVEAPAPGDDGYMPFTIMNTLLGGAFSSRNTAVLREEKGYAYSPNSSITARRDAALWQMEADVTTMHTADAISTMFAEIERLRSAPPSPEELTAIKNYRAGLFVLSNSSPNGLLGQLAFMDLHALPEDFLTRWVENVYALTPEQISQAARDWLDVRKSTIVIVGDLEQVGDSLRSLPEFAGATFVEGPDAG